VLEYLDATILFTCQVFFREGEGIVVLYEVMR